MPAAVWATTRKSPSKTAFGSSSPGSVSSNPSRKGSPRDDLGLPFKITRESEPFLLQSCCEVALIQFFGSQARLSLFKRASGNLPCDVQIPVKHTIEGDGDDDGFEDDAYRPEADDAGILWCPQCGSEMYGDATRCPSCG